jgi:hypothetical protein
MSLILIQLDSSRGTVTVHEPLIQDLLLGAAAVAGSRGYRAILKEYWVSTSMPRGHLDPTAPGAGAICSPRAVAVMEMLRGDVG